MKFEKKQKIFATTLCVILLVYLLAKRRKVSRKIGQKTAASVFHDYMTTENDNVFRDVTRMDRNCFKLLTDCIIDEGDLKGTEYLSPGVKLLIYIQMLRGDTFRKIEEVFNVSLAKNSDVVDEVATAIINIQHIYIRPPSVNVIPDKISTNWRFNNFFSNCLGAIDGTHVKARIPSHIAKPFRNRSGDLTQNVMAAVDFDMKFTYVLPGFLIILNNYKCWEGSAHDSKVFNSAVTNHHFNIPTEKFYIADGGYGLSKQVLTPYRGARYHLKEFKNGTQGPQNYKEYFNMRHSSLRNVVERVFGMLKKRFSFINEMPTFTY